MAGLPPGLKKLLQVPAVYQRKSGVDEWGNDMIFPPQDIKCFVDEENAAYGERDLNDQVTSTPTITVPIYVDAMEARVEDYITVDDRLRVVTQVSNIRNIKGAVVAQILTTTTT